MNYEEKYKEALEKARIYRNHLIETGDDTNEIEYIFPELINKDEKIRKSLIKYLETLDDEEIRYGVSFKEMCSWLEKQDEQNKKYLDIIISLWDLLDKIDTYADLKINNTNTDNPFRKIEHITQERHKFVKSDGYNLFIDDKQITNLTYTKHDTIEPKFKVGDWITNGEYTWKVTGIKPLDYILQSQNGDEIYYTISYVDENFRLWDIINDAKNGDVLLFEGYYNSIVLFQGIGINGKGRINYHCKCDIGDYSFGIQGDVACLGTIEKDAEHYHPATKELRDKLFQKMLAAGYEWDYKTKQLIKKQS